GMTRQAAVDRVRAIAEAVDAGRESADVRWESFSDAFVSEVRRARTVVDVGFYTRLALKYGPPDVRVIAIEPDPDRADALADVGDLGGDDRVMLCRVA